MNKYWLFILIIALSSCSGRTKDSYTMTVYTEEGCERIFAELDYARRYRQNLRRNDRFMLRYMLVIPAIIETYNITVNEKKVDDRIDHLQYQAQRNNCYDHNANASSTFVPYSQGKYQKNNASSSQRQSTSKSSNSFMESLKKLFN